MQNVTRLQHEVKMLNADTPRNKMYVLKDPQAGLVEDFLKKRVTSYEIQKNNPLIIETFT